MFAVELLLLIYFSFVSFYAFFFGIAAIFFKKPIAPDSPRKRTFAVLIPAYKEDNVIVSVAREALTQNYPQHCFKVIVVADSLKRETLTTLQTLPVHLVEVSLPKSTKVNALNKAFDAITEDYEYALILDADNVMERDFLTKINNLISLGFQAIQAERTSKNENNSMSLLDGFSERINNYIYRQGHVAVGLSCSLIGSGMVFPFGTVKNILRKLNSVGGFDRELELDLIRNGIKIHYAKDVIVFDEKVEDPEVFERQRTRWLSSQFLYLKKYFFEGMAALLKGNISMFNSAILKNIQLPRLVNLGLLIFFSLLVFIFTDKTTFGKSPWLLFTLMNLAAICLAIPPRYYTWEMFRSILLLPKIFLKLVKILFKLRGANRSFIHTPHGVSKAEVHKKSA